MIMRRLPSLVSLFSILFLITNFTGNVLIGNTIFSNIAFAHEIDMNDLINIAVTTNKKSNKDINNATLANQAVATGNLVSGSVKTSKIIRVADRSLPTGEAQVIIPDDAKRIVFVTDGVWLGDMGGLSGVLGKCTDAARAVPLEGKYLPWISTENFSPFADFKNQDTLNVPYVMLSGEQVAESFSALTSGTLEHAIDINEWGIKRDTTLGVWTNTTYDGKMRPGGLDCSGWTDEGSTAEVGDTAHTDAKWTDSYGAACDGATFPSGSGGHLYCFQQDVPTSSPRTHP
jgi:hypothetical protein